MCSVITNTFYTEEILGQAPAPTMKEQSSVNMKTRKPVLVIPRSNLNVIHPGNRFSINKLFQDDVFQ